MFDKPYSSRPTDRTPLLDSRAATRCPVRTRLDIDPPAGEPVPVPLPESVRARMEDGRAFEAEIMAELDDAFGPILRCGSPDATLTAMATGVPVIAQASLVDTAGHRTGRPDLVVATGAVNTAGNLVYVPVDIKVHQVAQTAGTGHAGALRAVAHTDLVGLDPVAVPEDQDRFARKHPGDLMVLAHYHRLLDAAGHADEAWGGILGTDRIIAVHDLTAVRFASWRNAKGKWSVLEKYDREFGFRLDVASLAADRAAGVTTETATVVPARNSDCPTCPHRLWCGARMDAADELTLLPGIGWDERHRLHGLGVATRTALAAADLDGLPTATLRRAADDARVLVAGVPAARRRGTDQLVLPRADVEVDVDMESTPDGRVYLWGARTAGPYLPFADFAADPDDHAVFAGFWTWLSELRDATVAAGRTFAAYCWSAPSAENRGTHHPLGDILHQLRLVLRGWCNYFRHGVSSRTFGYLAHFTWTRVVIWLRNKHRKVNWKTLRHRWLCGYRRWWPTDGQQELFDPNTVPITRYRYRGAQIPTPWDQPGTHPSSDLTRHVESRMRGNAHVRFGEREEGRPASESRQGVPPPTSLGNCRAG